MKNFLLLLLLAACWGPSFLFMKIAVAHIEPISIAAFRVTLAGVLLYFILKAKKINLPTNKKALKDFAFMGFFSCALPFTMFTLGEQYIDSSLASILNGTVPLFTLVIAHFTIESDRLTKAKFFGSVIGFLGLFVLVAPKLFETTATALGILAIITAAASYAIGLIYAKKHIHNYKPLVVPTAQLLFASLYLLPLAFIFENPAATTNASLIEIASVIALAVIGTSLAFVIYFKLIVETSATYTSSVTYIVPIFGMILGALILDEKLFWNSYLGTALILTGVMVVNGFFAKLVKKLRSS
jgi:drug/metabolite transporter (DMT)-like permease